MSIKQISVAIGVLALATFSLLAVRDMSSVDNNTKDTRDLYKEMQNEDRGVSDQKEVVLQTSLAGSTSSSILSQEIDRNEVTSGEEISSSTVE